MGSADHGMERAVIILAVAGTAILEESDASEHVPLDPAWSDAIDSIDAEQLLKAGEWMTDQLRAHIEALLDKKTGMRHEARRLLLDSGAFLNGFERLNCRLQNRDTDPVALMLLQSKSGIISLLMETLKELLNCRD